MTIGHNFHPDLDFGSKVRPSPLLSYPLCSRGNYLHDLSTGLLDRAIPHDGKDSFRLHACGTKAKVEKKFVALWFFDFTWNLSVNPVRSNDISLPFVLRSVLLEYPGKFRTAMGRTEKFLWPSHVRWHTKFSFLFTIWHMKLQKLRSTLCRGKTRTHFRLKTANSRISGLS